MPFPRKNLNAYEEVAVDLNPHWWFLIEPAATMGAVIIASILLNMYFDVTVLRWISVAALVIAVLWMAWRLITWKSTYFVVTSDRVIYQAGVFAKRGIQIPLERVNNVNFHQGLFERMLGTGDLLIESGGEQGQQRFSDIKHPDKVQNLIHASIESNENRKFGMAGSLAGPGLAGGTDVVGQLEKLEGLLQRGSISQAEYDAQKARLLQ
jgi:membrane protein YdbS with pleckstrin-like domain